ncbi:hypothetical protein GPECTOR_5g427 [Gonium pectorale]|uniref:Uncharacterized protein n=1 Tax=Gonium pectorale TaxID=33097 RepID=A0A150GX15_GONPE|nr:hypothetical protein GPECTOR_5g427 [Gonium pectorale]|eukprot:KXZ54345.1 hypothetical protein GPECTOR_5g427 [Gonium pectorale]
MILLAGAAWAGTLALLLASPAGRDRPKMPLAVRALYVSVAAVCGLAADSALATLLSAALLTAPQLARRLFEAPGLLGKDGASRLRVGGGPVVLYLALLAFAQCRGPITAAFAAAVGLGTWLAPDEEWPPRGWWPASGGGRGSEVKKGRQGPKGPHAACMALGSVMLAWALAQKLWA